MDKVTLSDKLKAVEVAYFILDCGVGGNITQADVDGARKTVDILGPQIAASLGLEAP
jgi:hypothetical protein